MIFHSDEFIFDGRNSKTEGIALVNTTDSEILMDYGVPFSNKLRAESSFGGNPFYVREDSTPEPISIEFCLLEDEHIGAVWTEDWEERILAWLVQDKFCEFQSYDYPDLYFYFMATKVTKKRNHQLRGILEIEFQPYYKHPIRKVRKKVNVVEEAIITINNTSLSKKHNYPIIKIRATKDGDLTINNKSIQGSSPLKITGLKEGQEVIIDNAMYIVTDTEGNNLFHMVNRNWLGIKHGKNDIKITGNAKVEIQCNLEIRV